MIRDEQGFFEKCLEARKLAFSFDDPLIVHHYDADGVSSGALVAGSFTKENKKFRMEILSKLNFRRGQKLIISMAASRRSKRTRFCMN